MDKSSSICTSTRRVHASSNSTPLIFGMMSTITGGVPMRKKLSGSAKSFAQAVDWCSKLCERGIYGFAVFRIGANQNVQIFGSTRLGMK
jgi:hypothetical protein